MLDPGNHRVMDWPRLAVLLAAAVIAGCGGGAREGAQRPAQEPAPGQPPAPDAPLSHTTGGLASALAATTRDLEAAIRDWLRSGPALRERPPSAVTLYALHHQRLYRHLRARPGLAQRVIARLPARLRSSARDNVAAGRSLIRLAPSKPPKNAPRVRTGPPEPPQVLLRFYRRAERRFGVSWRVLAAINLVETGFGRMRNASYAGAQGPMQFIRPTWEAYGMGGDIHDPHDAIMGAANYLRASGAPSDYRRALYAYNNSRLYVDAILRYARQIRRRPERFYTYWSWQVFVRTPTGDRRLTGPGA